MSRIFKGLCQNGIVKLMQDDLFWGRLEYPGGFWQLQDDTASGDYERDIILLKNSGKHEFKLTGKKFYEAMDKLASFMTGFWSYKIHINFNVNWAPFMGVLDDSVDGMNVMTVGVGKLDPDEKVSDMYFGICALNLLHMYRHFDMRFSGYLSTEYNHDMDVMLACNNMAIQHNERYGRRNYNTFPIEIEAERYATLLFGGILQEYVSTEYLVDLLVACEDFKARRFNYFIDELEHKSGQDGFEELECVLDNALARSFHCHRHYNPLEDKNDLVMRLLDDPHWQEIAMQLFSESDGHQKDRKMCALITHIFPEYI